jgi:hypothetical protein
MKKNNRFAAILLLMIAFAFTSSMSNAQRGGRGGFGGGHFGGGFGGGFSSHFNSGVRIGASVGYHTRVLPYGGIYRLPSSYLRLSFGGFPYFFADGLFYAAYGDYYGLVAPPFGLTLGFLPRGYWGFNWGGFPYYYYSGVFYKPTEDKKYQVVVPPVGAEVPSIPKEAKPIVVNDQKLYEYLGTYYKEVMGADGKIKYIVQGKDGVLNTDNVKDSVGVQNNYTHDHNYTHNHDTNTQLATIYTPSVGDIVLQLPSQTMIVIVNGKKLYVTPEHIYYEEFVDGNVLKYKIVGK